MAPDGKIIEWTQPEILLYDDDPLIRMSYPDLVEDDGKYYITETQKDIARVHEIDQGLLEGLWNQFDNRQKTSMAWPWNGIWKMNNFPCKKKGSNLIISMIMTLAGRTMEACISVQDSPLILPSGLNDLGPGQILIDTRNEFGKGLQLFTTDEKTVRLSMSDGRTTSTWDCDKGMLEAGKDHYMSVIVDGGPKIIMFVIDGILCDGGDDRQFGWGRFNPYLQEVNGVRPIGPWAKI